MKQISFALTADQVRLRTKTVTRRLGWEDLHPGALLQPVVKSQGLKKGEHVDKIGGPIRVVSVTREMLQDIQLHREDLVREGFPALNVVEFVHMFCVHNRCTPGDIVTRIEFEYVDEERES